MLLLWTLIYNIKATENQKQKMFLIIQEFFPTLTLGEGVDSTYFQQNWMNTV